MNRVIFFAVAALTATNATLNAWVYEGVWGSKGQATANSTASTA
jgi:hypothetical protein